MTATSLIQLVTNYPEIYAFIIGFSFTVWTKKKALVGSLTDGMQADTILIPPHPLKPPTNNKKVRGP